MRARNGNRNLSGAAWRFGLALLVMLALVSAGDSTLVDRPGEASPSVGVVRADTLDLARTVAEVAVVAEPAFPSAPVVVAGAVSFAYGPGPAHVIDVHLPRRTTPAGAPAVIYLHSGGWSAGSRASVPDLIASQVERGWAVLAPSYRLAPEHPFPRANEDVDRAIRWVKWHATELGIDSTRIVIAGGSAGGHLATVAAASPGRFRDSSLPAELAPIYPDVRGVVALVAPTDLAAMLSANNSGRSLTAGYLGCSPRWCDASVVASASPAKHIVDRPPPAMFVFGERDTLVPASRHGAPIVTAWLARSGDAESFVVAGAGHNIDASVVDQSRVDAFLDGVIG